MLCCRREGGKADQWSLSPSGCLARSPNNHCVNAVVCVRTQVEHSSVQTLCCLATLVLLGVLRAQRLLKRKESKASSLLGLPCRAGRGLIGRREREPPRSSRCSSKKMAVGRLKQGLLHPGWEGGLCLWTPEDTTPSLQAFSGCCIC